MSKEKSDTHRRKRRTKQALERDILNALESFIKEVGFENMTMTGLAQRADVLPAMLYNRYTDMNDLLDKYVRRYDYWLSDIVNFSKSKKEPDEIFKDVLVGLIDALYDNEVMQKLLIWELSSVNETTQRTANSRELHSRVMLEFFDKNLSDDATDFAESASLLIGGIYYLILHKDTSTFCDIDYTTKEGKKKLINSVTNITDSLFGNKKTRLIAKKLLEEGVDRKIIKNATGLSLKEIDSL